MLHWYQHLPEHIGPIAFQIGSFAVRWYSLSYLIAFVTVYLLLVWRIKKVEINVEKQTKEDLENTLIDFMLVAIFASLLGGRMGYVLFYNAHYFLVHPKEIFFPFDSGGNYSGFFGMSYHGALLGVLFGSWIFLKIKHIDFLHWADFVVPAVPLGYFFGRLGNFLNGELYGRITTSRWGMYFERDLQNLRFPSQIVEALLEGIVLFIVLWLLRNKIKIPGALLAFYLMGYAFFRILGEFFRQPDPQIGYLWNFFTLGQMLSLTMFFAGFILWLKIKIKYKS